MKKFYFLLLVLLVIVMTSCNESLYTEVANYNPLPIETTQAEHINNEWEVVGIIECMVFNGYTSKNETIKPIKSEDAEDKEFNDIYHKKIVVKDPKTHPRNYRIGYVSDALEACNNELKQYGGELKIQNFKYSTNSMVNPLNCDVYVVGEVVRKRK